MGLTTRRGATPKSARTAAAAVASLLVMVGVAPASATPGDITTIAGHDPQAQIQGPNGMARFGETLFVSDYNSYTVVARDLTTGEQTVYAGSPGVLGSSGDGGIATQAGLQYPGSLATDSAGNLYINEFDFTGPAHDCRIRRVDRATRVISTWAGNGGCANNAGDGGDKLAAEVGSTFMVFDASDNMYIADGEHRIRRIDHATGVIDTVAGQLGSPGYVDDADPLTARFTNIDGLAFGPAGDLYLSDRGNNAIRRIDAGFTTVTTVAGGGLSAGPGHDDGPVGAASFSMGWLATIAMSPAGELYIWDEGNSVTRKLSADGTTVSTVMGTPGTPGDTGDDGPAVVAAARTVRAYTFDTSGGVYLAQLGGNNNNLRYIDAGGIVHNRYNTTPIGDGHLAAESLLSQPIDLARVGSSLYVVEQAAPRIRRIDLSNNVITTVAGTGIDGFSGDGGPAALAGLSGPKAMVHDPTGGGALLIAGLDGRIRRIDLATNIITTVAGTGTPGFSGDGGPAPAAQLSGSVLGLAVTAAGDIVVSDSGNRRLRRIDRSTGVITTIAGNGAPTSAGGTGSPDGTPAVSATLITPIRVVVAPDGAIVFGDGCDIFAVLDPLLSGIGTPESKCDGRVRRIDPATGALTTIAGIAGDLSGGGDDGPATSASIANPLAFRYAADGSLYVGQMGASYLDFMMVMFGAAPATSVHPSIRRIDAATGIITTVAGNGVLGFAGDGGPATSASLGLPTAIAPDAGTHLFVADLLNNRIRRIEGVRPDLVTTLQGGPFQVGRPGTVVVTERNNSSVAVTGPIHASLTLPAGLTFVSAGGNGWSCTTRGQVVSCANPSNLPAGESTGFTITVSVGEDAPDSVSLTLSASSDSDVINPGNQIAVLGIAIARAGNAPTDPAGAAARDGSPPEPGRSGGPAELAATGTNAASTAGTAAVLLFGGGAILLVARRRRGLSDPLTRISRSVRGTERLTSAGPGATSW